MKTQRPRGYYRQWIDLFQTMIADVENKGDYVMLANRLFPEEEPAFWWKETQEEVEADQEHYAREYPQYPLSSMVLIIAVGRLALRQLIAWVQRIGGEAQAQQAVQDIQRAMDFQSSTLN